MKQPRLRFVSKRAQDHLKLAHEDSVTIIIPTRDRLDLLRPCIESITEKTDFPNYKVVIVDNQSSDPATLSYFSQLDSNIFSIYRYPHSFNFSKMMNEAAENCDSEFVCFLNNDTVVQDEDWLRNLMDHGSREDVGVVGMKLLYPDATIQHVGIALGFNGVAMHAFRGETEAINNLQEPRVPTACFEVSAVTFACALTRKSTYFLLNGLDPELRVGFNDVDFGLKVSANQLKSVLCTESHLIHFESKSRKKLSTASGFVQALRETNRIILKWPRANRTDQYFRR